MANDFVLNAELRSDAGKGASRRLRRTAKVPAIIYGGDQAPTNIALDHDEFVHALENEAFYSHLVTINVDKNAELVIIKDLQRHPAKPKILHADFMRVRKDHKIIVHVPLHFINQDKCKGVKLQGGLISHQATDLEVRCLPGDLPEFIEIDMTEIEVGQTVHISDINLPKGVESVALSHGEDHDLALATVLAPRGGMDEEEGGAGEAPAPTEGA